MKISSFNLKLPALTTSFSNCISEFSIHMLSVISITQALTKFIFVRSVEHSGTFHEVSGSNLLLKYILAKNFKLLLKFYWSLSEGATRHDHGCLQKKKRKKSDGMKHGSYNCVDQKKMKDVNLTWFPGVLPAREKKTNFILPTEAEIISVR